MTRRGLLIKAAVAVTVVLLLTDAALAQRWVRGRRGRFWRVRPWYVPAQVYYPGWPVASPEEANPPNTDYVSSPPAAPPVETENDAAEEIAPPQKDTRVSFRVLLPTADARLWVDGYQAKGSGLSRDVVVTRPRADAERPYLLKGEWSRDGRVVTTTREVDGFPGDRITIDFTRPDPRRTVTEIVPREVPTPRD